MKNYEIILIVLTIIITIGSVFLITYESSKTIIGDVVVKRIINTSGPGYAEPRTWTLEFEGSNKVYIVDYSGSSIQIGDQFKLYMTKSGKYVFSE